MLFLRACANLFYSVKLSFFAVVLPFLILFGLPLAENDGFVNPFRLGEPFDSQILFVFLILFVSFVVFLRGGWVSRLDKLRVGWAFVSALDFLGVLFAFYFAGDVKIFVFFLFSVLVLGDVLIGLRLAKWDDEDETEDIFSMPEPEPEDETEELGSTEFKKFVFDSNALDLDSCFDWWVERENYSDFFVPVCEVKDFVFDVEGIELVSSNRLFKGELRKLVLERFSYRCVVCWTMDELEVDHVVSHYNGGETSFDNAQVLCRWCNESKGSLNQSEWELCNSFKMRLGLRYLFRYQTRGRSHARFEGR